MAESVGQEDYGWFTPADLVRVLKAIRTLPNWERVILIGGQSLTAWVQHYQIDLPAFEGPFLTADADFLASKADAELIASYLKGDAHFPSLDDHTPNTAVIDFTSSSGDLLHIDILGAVLGLNDEDVKRLATPIQVEGVEEIVYVLHPLLVLESRCINLMTLSEKRNANGITQAQVACLVARKYLEECLSNAERRRESLRAAKRIGRLAVSQPGVFVHRQWGIDVLGVIDASKMPGKFELSWTFVKLRAAYKRGIAARRTTKSIADR